MPKYYFIALDNYQSGCSPIFESILSFVVQDLLTSNPSSSHKLVFKLSISEPTSNQVRNPLKPHALSKLYLMLRKRCLSNLTNQPRITLKFCNNNSLSLDTTFILKSRGEPYIKTV